MVAGCSIILRLKAITVEHITKSQPGRVGLTSMSLTEQKKKVVERKNYIEQLLESAYQTIQINERNCFRDKSGRLFTLFALLKDGALGLEYAENIAEARLNRFEDGDLFYIEDMDKETMLQAIMNEINT